MAKKIAIIIRKGGSGKTTTATNLSTALHQAGKRTLLVDLDRQANATLGVGLNPYTLETSLKDLFVDPNRDPRSVIQTTSFGLDVLPAHGDLAKVEMGMRPDDMWTLEEILKPLDAEYDYMIFDTSPAEGLMAYNALAAADEVIIPVAASSFSEDGLAQAIDAINRARQKYNKKLKLRNILLTKAERTLISSSLLESIIKDYPDSLFKTSVVKSTVVDQANELGQPVMIYDPEHRAAEAYRQLAESIINGDA